MIWKYCNPKVEKLLEKIATQKLENDWERLQPEGWEMI
jgi:hypothetical protein